MTVPWQLEGNCDNQANIERVGERLFINFDSFTPSEIFILEDLNDDKEPEYFNLHSQTIKDRKLLYKNKPVSNIGETFLLYPNGRNCKSTGNKFTEPSVLICYEYKQCLKDGYNHSPVYELVNVFCLIVAPWGAGNEIFQKIIIIPNIKTRGKHRKSLLKSSAFGVTEVKHEMGDKCSCISII